jgi:hypothetical protein
VALLRAHLVAVAIVVAAVAVLGGVLAFARPTYHRYVMPAPPGDGLSYTAVTSTRADAGRAFAAHGIALQRGPKQPGIADLHTRDSVLEVTVFGDRKTVDAAGFSDYYTFADGAWSLAPKNCVAGAKNAERWRGNVRLIVTCSAPDRLAPAARALASLSR